MRPTKMNLEINWRFGIPQLLLACTWTAIWGGLVYKSSHSESSAHRFSEIAFSADGSLAAIGGYRDTRIYRGSTLLATIPYSNKRVSGMKQLKFIDDETLGIVATEAIYFYSIPARRVVRHIPLQQGLERALILRDRILVQHFSKSTVNHQFKLYAIDADKDSMPISTHNSPHVNTGMSATQDGMFVAFYLDNMDVELLDQLPRGTYRLYDIQLQADRKELPPANGIQFSPDDSMIAVCNRRISLYDWPSLSEKWNVTIEPCHDIRFSDDGRRFAVLNQSNDCLFVFDSSTGTQLTRIAVAPEHGNGFSFSADGEAIWLPAQDELGGIQEWSIRSGKTSRRIGNATNTWWILFSFLFAGWSFLYSLICDIPQKNQKSLIGALSLSFSVFAAGVTILIIGVLRCLSGMLLYQNASIRNYILTLSFNTFLLVVACRVLMLGCSYLRATLTRKHKSGE